MKEMLDGNGCFSFKCKSILAFRLLLFIYQLMLMDTTPANLCKMYSATTHSEPNLVLNITVIIVGWYVNVIIYQLMLMDTTPANLCKMYSATTHSEPNLVLNITVIVVGWYVNVIIKTS